MAYRSKKELEDAILKGEWDENYEVPIYIRARDLALIGIAFRCLNHFHPKLAKRARETLEYLFSQVVDHDNETKRRP